MNNIFRGKVIYVNQEENTPNPHSYIISNEDDPSKTYLAHVGDLKDNEDLLYQLYKSDKTAKLEKDDLVQFELSSKQDHPIHVKKLSD